MYFPLSQTSLYVILFKLSVYPQCLLSLGSKVTEPQAYTDIHTKDRPALAGGPSIDKCVFCFGGERGRGVNAHLQCLFLF